MSSKRCIILIDGSNFYFKLKDLKLHNLLNFDFSKFALELAGKDKIVHATYYIGKVKTDGTKRTNLIHANQQKLFVHLRNHNFNYSLGYLLKSDGKFHEKGVDVNIAVDILVGAYENICDRIIIVSSDTDLLPAVKKAKQKKKIVEFVGFSHMPSYAMMNNCSKYTLLSKKDLQPFVMNKK